QLAQARATLASAKVNYDIAATTAGRYDTLVKKQAVAQQMADQTAADAASKKAVMDADAANVRQLEAMEAFKQIVAPFDGIVAQHVGRAASRQSGRQAFRWCLRSGRFPASSKPEHDAHSSHDLDASQPRGTDRGSWRRQESRAQVHPTRPGFWRQC